PELFRQAGGKHDPAAPPWLRGRWQTAGLVGTVDPVVELHIKMNGRAGRAGFGPPLGGVREMRIKSLINACAMTLTMTLMAAPVHAQDLLARIKNAGELVVGTEMQFAPFDFHENGQQTGFNKDLFGAVAEKLGVKVRFIDLPWPSVLPGLDASKFDMGGGPILVTQARKERYAFTLPVADGTVALLKSAKNDALQKPEDIAGLTVGGSKGSAQLEQLKTFAATLSKPVEVREYVDNNQAYADIVSGRLAAVGNSITNIAYVAKQRPKMFQV